MATTALSYHLVRCLCPIAILAAGACQPSQNLLPPATPPRADSLDNKQATDSGCEPTPLIQAILDRDEERFSELLGDGEDPNEWDKCGRNAVTIAATVPDSRYWLGWVLRHGGNPNAMASGVSKEAALMGGGNAPLHAAVTVQDNELNVRELVEAGAAINSVNTFGLTPLGLAVDNGHYEIAAYLISKGADPEAKSVGGFTIREIINDWAGDDSFSAEEKKRFLALQQLFEK